MVIPVDFAQDDRAPNQCENEGMRTLFATLLAAFATLASAQDRIFVLQNKGEGITLAAYSRKDGRWTRAQEVRLQTAGIPVERATMDPSRHYLCLECSMTDGFRIWVFDARNGRFLGETSDGMPWKDHWTWWSGGRLYVKDRLANTRNRLRTFDPVTQSWARAHCPDSQNPLAPWNYKYSAKVADGWFSERGLLAPAITSPPGQVTTDFTATAQALGPGQKLAAVLQATGPNQIDVVVASSEQILGRVSLKADLIDQVALTEQFLVVKPSQRDLQIWPLSHLSKPPEILEGYGFVWVQDGE